MIEMRINGVSSTTIDKLYISTVNAPVPSKTEERVQILNEQGTRWVSERYNDREVRVGCIIKNVDKFGKSRDFMDYIRFDTEALITFSHDETIFYVGRFNRFEIYEQTAPNVVKFDIVFKCEPEIYNVFNSTVPLDQITTKGVIEAMTLGVNYYYGINPTQ